MRIESLGRRALYTPTTHGDGGRAHRARYRYAAAMPKPPAAAPCPCDETRRYAACCAPLHAGEPAATAEALMRSRYSAYALGLEHYLLASWHASTRPAALNLAAERPAPKWLGLKVLRHEPDGDRAQVEFVARFRVGGGSAQRLHERSRFVREQNRWYYLEGQIGD